MKQIINYKMTLYIQQVKELCLNTVNGYNYTQTEDHFGSFYTTSEGCKKTCKGI